jgi:hypothetical protein
MNKNTLLLIIGLMIAIVSLVALMNMKEKKVSSESVTGETEHGGFFGFIEGALSGLNINLTGGA